MKTRKQSEINAMLLLLQECYEDIKSVHERNEIQAAMTILRRNYTDSHYKGTPYEKITKAAMEWLNDTSLSELHVFDYENIKKMQYLLIGIAMEIIFRMFQKTKHFLI